MPKSWMLSAPVLWETSINRILSCIFIYPQRPYAGKEFQFYEKLELFASEFGLSINDKKQNSQI